MYSTVPRPRRPRSNWLANSYALVGTAVTYKWALPLGGRVGLDARLKVV